MSLLKQLADPAVWEEFYFCKEEKQHLSKRELQDLRMFIDEKGYLPVVENIRNDVPWPYPERKLIRKIQTEKKRIVYIFPRSENYVLKMLSFLLLRKYDSVFSPNLYSFRVSCGVGKAMNSVLGIPHLEKKYTYKTDIHDYFNSIDVRKMCSQLDELLTDEPEILRLLKRILNDPHVKDGEDIVSENKGVMAGTPVAVFLANLYLKAMDEEFCSAGISYARYSDDIFVLSDSEEERNRAAGRIRDILSNYGLEINPKKEVLTDPGDPWTFLGICYESGIVDISSVSKEKIKDKIRRKARAIKRWQIRKQATEDQAVRAFIRSMNRKFFELDSNSELTWTRWYFPLINTDKSLREIDQYMQYWIRYIATGTHSKASFRFRYEQMKEFGYRSLVHEWYAGREEE